MRTYMKEVREGENMGPIDWAYNFRQHLDGMYPNEGPEGRDKICAERVEWLRQIDTAFREGKRVCATNYGGCPRIWQDVIDVGMYDGWPYWKPTPSVCLRSIYGGEWYAFHRLTSAPVIEASSP